jgi:hypothetical protein
MPEEMPSLSQAILNLVPLEYPRIVSSSSATQNSK